MLARAAVLVAFVGCAATPPSVGAQGEPPPFERVPAASGRDVQGITVSESTGEWLLSECSREVAAEGNCHLLKYDPATKVLSRYDLSNRYLYSYPRFSHDGKMIVANRAPRHDGTAAGSAQSAAAAEIIQFPSDGGRSSAVPVPAGLNLGPSLSPSGDSVAYWKATPRLDPNRRTDLANFDLYRYDFKSREEKLFAGSNQYFSGGPIYWMDDQTIVATADVPKRRVTSSVSQYRTETNGSEIHTFTSAGQSAHASYTETINARLISLDRERNAYFLAQPDRKKSLSFIRMAPRGAMTAWGVPNVPYILEVVADPSGRYVLFVCPAEGASFADRKNAIGMLSLDTGRMAPVLLPPLREGVIIHVD